MIVLFQKAFAGLQCHCAICIATRFRRHWIAIRFRRPYAPYLDTCGAQANYCAPSPYNVVVSQTGLPPFLDGTCVVAWNLCGACRVSIEAPLSGKGQNVQRATWSKGCLNSQFPLAVLLHFLS